MQRRDDARPGPASDPPPVPPVGPPKDGAKPWVPALSDLSALGFRTLTRGEGGSPWMMARRTEPWMLGLTKDFKDCLPRFCLCKRPGETAGCPRLVRRAPLTPAASASPAAAAGAALPPPPAAAPPPAAESPELTCPEHRGVLVNGRPPRSDPELARMFQCWWIAVGPSPTAAVSEVFLAPTWSLSLVESLCSGVSFQAQPQPIQQQQTEKQKEKTQGQPAGGEPGEPAASPAADRASPAGPAAAAAAAAEEKKSGVAGIEGPGLSVFLQSGIQAKSVLLDLIYQFIASRRRAMAPGQVPVKAEAGTSPLGGPIARSRPRKSKPSKAADMDSGRQSEPLQRPTASKGYASGDFTHHDTFTPEVHPYMGGMANVNVPPFSLGSGLLGPAPSRYATFPDSYVLAAGPAPRQPYQYDAVPKAEDLFTGGPDPAEMAGTWAAAAGQVFGFEAQAAPAAYGFEDQAAAQVYGGFPWDGGFLGPEGGHYPPVPSAILLNGQTEANTHTLSPGWGAFCWGPGMVEGPPQQQQHPGMRQQAAGNGHNNNNNGHAHGHTNGHGGNGHGHHHVPSHLGDPQPHGPHAADEEGGAAEGGEAGPDGCRSYTCIKCGSVGFEHKGWGRPKLWGKSKQPEYQDGLCCHSCRTRELTTAEPRNPRPARPAGKPSKAHAQSARSESEDPDGEEDWQLVMEATRGGIPSRARAPPPPPPRAPEPRAPAAYYARPEPVSRPRPAPAPPAAAPQHAHQHAHGHGHGYGHAPPPPVREASDSGEADGADAEEEEEEMRSMQCGGCTRVGYFGTSRAYPKLWRASNDPKLGGRMVCHSCGMSEVMRQVRSKKRRRVWGRPPKKHRVKPANGGSGHGHDGSPPGMSQGESSGDGWGQNSDEGYVSDTAAGGDADIGAPAHLVGSLPANLLMHSLALPPGVRPPPPPPVMARGGGAGYGGVAMAGRMATAALPRPSVGSAAQKADARSSSLPSTNAAGARRDQDACPDGAAALGADPRPVVPVSSGSGSDGPMEGGRTPTPDGGTHQDASPPPQHASSSLPPPGGVVTVRCLTAVHGPSTEDVLRRALMQELGRGWAALGLPEDLVQRLSSETLGAKRGPDGPDRSGSPSGSKEIKRPKGGDQEEEGGPPGEAPGPPNGSGGGGGGPGGGPPGPPDEGDEKQPATAAPCHRCGASVPQQGPSDDKASCGHVLCTDCVTRFATDSSVPAPACMVCSGSCDCAACAPPAAAPAADSAPAPAPGPEPAAAAPDAAPLPPPRPPVPAPATTLTDSLTLPPGLTLKYCEYALVAAAPALDRLVRINLEEAAAGPEPQAAGPAEAAALTAVPRADPGYRTNCDRCKTAVAMMFRRCPKGSKCKREYSLCPACCGEVRDEARAAVGPTAVPFLACPSCAKAEYILLRERSTRSAGILALQLARVLPDSLLTGAVAAHRWAQAAAARDPLPAGLEVFSNDGTNLVPVSLGSADIPWRPAARRKDGQRDNVLLAPTAASLRPSSRSRPAALHAVVERLARGVPCVVTGVKATDGMWTPEGLLAGMKKEEPLWRVLDCASSKWEDVPPPAFFQGFIGLGPYAGRMLKLKDFPANDSFAAALKAHYDEFLAQLPIPELMHLTRGPLNAPCALLLYSQTSTWPGGADGAPLANLAGIAADAARCGRSDRASRGLAAFRVTVPPDLGPKAYVAFGSLEHRDAGAAGGSVTRCHTDMSDACNILEHCHVIEPWGLEALGRWENPLLGPDGASEPEVFLVWAALDPNLAASPDASDRPIGAVWHLWRREDRPALAAFLEEVRDRVPYCIGEDGAIESVAAAGLRCNGVDGPYPEGVDPIHDQHSYLTPDLLDECKRVKGIEPWIILQREGDAVIVPAGCPHQVRNLRPCIKAAADFVAPSSLATCLELAESWRTVAKERPTHPRAEDKLQGGLMLACLATEAHRQVQEGPVARRGEGPQAAAAAGGSGKAEAASGKKPAGKGSK